VETIDPAIAPGLCFRGYGEFSSVARTGLAVANASAQQATVTVELRHFNASLRHTADVVVAPFSQRAFFLDELPGLDTTSPFQGIVRISSPGPVAVTAVRTRVNQGGDFLVASTPPDNLSQIQPGSGMLFPFFVLGSGSDMEFVLINSQDDASADGTMYFFSRDGNPFPMSIP
jgi:hypothetical protein